jgi:hypothetical protein
MGKTSVPNGIKKADKQRGGKEYKSRVSPSGVQTTRFKTAKQLGEN